MGLKGIGLVFDFVFNVYFELVSTAHFRDARLQLPFRARQHMCVCNAHVQYALVNCRKYQSICKFIFHHVAHDLLHRGAFLGGKLVNLGLKLAILTYLHLATLLKDNSRKTVRLS